MNSPKRYFDRDLSWLSFNHRILEEAQYPEVPLYERIKFLAIYSSNLDEFFRVRVASVQDAVKKNEASVSLDQQLDNETLLKKIFATVDQQQNEFGRIYREKILPALKEEGIILYNQAEIPESHENAIRTYFRSKVLTYIRPIIFSDKSERPFLVNKALYFILQIRRKSDPQAELQYALLNIPSDQLPRFFKLPVLDGFQSYIFLDDIIRCNLKSIFPGFEILDCYSIKLNRDADLKIEDEEAGDLVHLIESQLESRDSGDPARFLYDSAMPRDVLENIMENCQINEADAVPGGRYHNFFDLMQLPNPKKPQLEDQDLPTLYHQVLDQQESMFEAICQKDFILHFPYQSYDYVLRFFNEAAIDPHVDEIKLTVYRVASNSYIANALISAVKNGKKVTVFVEVKARFDEANNLKWAKALEREGVNIIYSIPNLKVHAKVALVIRKPGNTRQAFAFFGTGNFNEKTAQIYADHGFFTSNSDLTRELCEVFDYLDHRSTKPPLEHLLVSQINILDKFYSLIDYEIAQAKAGKEAKMIIKINNLEYDKMIDKLYEAARAGVKVELIVRSICCLVPAEKELSENIRVTRIVDRYLEHARIFLFHRDGNPAVFLGSSDWMKRNLKHRVEVVFPVYDEEIKQELIDILNIQLRDNQKARVLDPDHHNLKKEVLAGDKSHRAQEETYTYIRERMKLIEG